jgi:hypothetical protein
MPDRYVSMTTVHIPLRKEVPVHFQGKGRLGFYPLPLSEALRIRRYFLFPDQPSSALDPCIGDGVAFEAITSDAEVLRYGIELDAYRAEQARQRIPNIVQGNTLEVQCPVKCFGLPYLNPPYDWTLGPADSRRTEQSFLSHTYRWLKPDGVLLFVIPGDRLTECCQILSTHFRDVRVYRLEAPECVRYKQVVVIGLGCPPVLVSGTKKLFLKWIRRALRHRRIEVPECTGPVRWSMANSFFPINQNDLGPGSRQEPGEESPATLAEEETQSCESS